MPNKTFVNLATINISGVLCSLLTGIHKQQVQCILHLGHVQLDYVLCNLKAVF